MFAACFDANGACSSRSSRSGRHHFRQSQPRLDHRRRPPQQGEPLPLCQFGMNELEDRLRRGRGGRAVQAHRHRRRVLDGRLYRQAEGDLRAADRYGALVLVDDCHATGHLGEKGAARRR